MNELEKELDEIMNNAMTQLDSERLTHQEKVIEMLEQNMFDEHGLPELAELYGVVEVAEGEKDIAEFIKNIPSENHFVDATKDNKDPCGIAGLMRIVHCGNGTDIYEPLQDISVQIGMSEFCRGLMIRVPITGKHRNDETIVRDGSITCLALENVISLVVRVCEGNADVCHTEVFDVATYTLGNKERKLIDAIYLAYFMPRYLKEHSQQFYASILMFNQWKKENEKE